MSEPSPAALAADQPPVAPAIVGPPRPTVNKLPARFSPLAKTMLTLFALAALAAWLPWLSPPLAQRLPTGRLQQQPAPAGDWVSRAEFEALKNQSTADRDAVAAAPVVTIPADDQALVAQVTALQTQLAEARAQMDQQQTRSHDEQQQLAVAIKGDSAQAALQAVAPLFLLNRLEDKLAQGRACQPDLDAAGSLLSSAERAELAPLAGGGPTADSLALQLDGRRRTLLAAWRDDAAVGWLDKVRARLSALISITGPDGPPDEAAAAYDRLRAQIIAGDDAGALAALRALPPTVRQGLTNVETALEARARALAAVGAAIERHAPVAATDAATPAVNPAAKSAAKSQVD